MGRHTVNSFSARDGGWGEGNLLITVAGWGGRKGGSLICLPRQQQPRESKVRQQQPRGVGSLGATPGALFTTRYALYMLLGAGLCLL